MHAPHRLLTTLFLPLLCACANGSSLSTGYEQQDNDGDGGAGGSNPATTSSSSSGGDSDGGAGGYGGESGEGGAGGVGGAGGEGGTEPGCAYDAPAPCASAEELNAVSGDSGSDLTRATGNTSRWFKIHILEDSLGSEQLSFTASLISPAGMNFDLYTYRGDADNASCLASGVKGEGTPEAVTAHWGDNFGSEDGTWYIVEVRYESGTACGDEANWALSVAGHTVP